MKQQITHCLKWIMCILLLINAQIDNKKTGWLYKLIFQYY